MFTFEEEKMSEELTKFHLRNLPFYGVFHHFTGADKGEAHDHPFPFTSLIIYGGYRERIWKLDGSYQDVERRVGDYISFKASHIHQIIDLPKGEAWTYITPGKHTGIEWGFYKFEDGKEFHRFHNEPDFKPLKEKQI